VVGDAAGGRALRRRRSPAAHWRHGCDGGAAECAGPGLGPRRSRSRGAAAGAGVERRQQPAGLVASTTLAHARPPQLVVDALLIGVDLGPNFSITGSLATILWLTALRREGQDVGFWRFLAVGAVVTPPALLLALAARLLVA
jgi:hypothetical protein